MAYEGNIYGRVPQGTSASGVQAEILALLRNAVPGYDDLIAKSTANIASGLRGELSSDVQDAVQNAAAARAVGGGYGGSGLHRNLVARDIATTSKQIQDDALKQALAQVQSASQTATLSPEQVLALDAYNKKLRAAPDPAARGRHDESLAWDAFNRASQVPAMRGPSPMSPSGSALPQHGGFAPPMFAQGTNRNIASPQYDTSWFTNPSADTFDNRPFFGPGFGPNDDPFAGFNPANNTSPLGDIYGTGGGGSTDFLNHDFSSGPYDWLGGGEYSWLGGDTSGSSAPAYNGPFAPDYQPATGGYDTSFDEAFDFSF